VKSSPDILIFWLSPGWPDFEGMDEGRASLFGNHTFLCSQGGQGSRIVEIEFFHQVSSVFFGFLDADTEKV
jgi:hypothetical protein